MQSKEVLLVELVQHNALANQLHWQAVMAADLAMMSQKGMTYIPGRDGCKV